MSLRHQRIGWVGAIAVALLSPLVVTAFHGFIDGFIEGFGGSANWMVELVALVAGILFAVWVVMGVSHILERRRGGSS